MSQPAAREQFFDLLRASISEGALSKLTLGKYRGADASLRNVFVRPVSLKSGPHLSFVYRHATRDITKNHQPDEALALLEKLIGAEFLDAHLFTAAQSAQLSHDSNGVARLRVKKTDAAPNAPASAIGGIPAAHDRARRQAIPLDAPWLHALGITNKYGKPREGMSAKLRQINKFAELLSHLATEAGLIEAPAIIPGLDEKTHRDAASALRIADMGCGKGYLTFATAALLGPRARIQGIEARPELVSFCNRIARETGFSNLKFVQGTIADAQLDAKEELAHDAPQNTLDILIALHACDTATDDAIARGIQSGARLIVVSPCCQKELRPQLTAPPVLAEALRHGIFQERQAEFVTDALRAQLLEHAGYRAKVFEFISTEHTAKNLMIAAIKTRPAGDEATLRKLRDLARFYGIRKQALASHLGIDLNF
ncbi:class I SAM-dependent methyltransferase [Ereboglobus luteus]|uniref:Methyltransferase n=1 Tax=Ereboglobus luteus TaxID=1796921 RepID=A0A2U8E544_9BACT|nr:SAM-dependent methyltransferase [Ereboglobus luteus]AWI09977.1 methyltransferase [Ereboglobus luteus]